MGIDIEISKYSHLMKDQSTPGSRLILRIGKPVDQMTISELKALCKAQGIKGYSKLRKQELLDIVQWKTR